MYCVSALDGSSAMSEGPRRIALQPRTNEQRSDLLFALASTASSRRPMISPSGESRPMAVASQTVQPDIEDQLQMRILWLLLAILFELPLMAATYYVSPSGN